MQLDHEREATYEDLMAVPEHLVAEILYGRLVTHPRPAPPHAMAALSLGDELVGPFQKSRGGPGGWIFMVEPELHLGRHIVVPDLAGWRKERLTTLPETAWIDTSPDWVCEIISPKTEKRDRGAKRAIYADAGVAHLWLVDPRPKVLEVFSLRDRNWLLEQTFTGDDDVAAPPFDAITFKLSLLWPLDPPEQPET